MVISTNERIPCRYFVAKYIGDEIRDEPINIGVLLQSHTNETKFKFITHCSKIRTASEEPTFLKQILENIQNEISKSGEHGMLDKIVSKYQGKVRFTEPRGTLVKSLDDELASLYNRFISIEKQSETIRPINITFVKKSVESFLHKLKKSIIPNKWFETQPGRFKWNFFIENQHLLHSISFNVKTALQTTKLFDWHARDLIERKKFVQKNFLAMILEPREENPQYSKLMAQYKESQKIWNSRSYELFKFDTVGKWQKEIANLIQ